jgi:hypothetical protein
MISTFSRAKISFHVFSLSVSGNGINLVSWLIFIHSKGKSAVSIGFHCCLSSSLLGSPLVAKAVKVSVIWRIILSSGEASLGDSIFVSLPVLKRHLKCGCETGEVFNLFISTHGSSSQWEAPGYFSYSSAATWLFFTKFWLVSPSKR